VLSVAGFLLFITRFTVGGGFPPRVYFPLHCWSWVNRLFSVAHTPAPGRLFRHNLTLLIFLGRTNSTGILITECENLPYSILRCKKGGNSFGRVLSAQNPSNLPTPDPGQEETSSFSPFLLLLTLSERSRNPSHPPVTPRSKVTFPQPGQCTDWSLSTRGVTLLGRELVCPTYKRSYTGVVGRWEAYPGWVGGP